uniref:Uncharacterized protein n=1 Tax=Anguilla anguilla TaxID=7936 RepID=A0A0E9UU58_ANGAN
MTRFSIAR